MKFSKNIIAIIAIAFVSIAINASYNKQQARIKDAQLRNRTINAEPSFSNQPYEMGTQLYGTSYENNYPSNENYGDNTMPSKPSYFEAQKNY